MTTIRYGPLQRLIWRQFVARPDAQLSTTEMVAIAYPRLSARRAEAIELVLGRLRQRRWLFVSGASALTAPSSGLPSHEGPAPDLLRGRDVSDVVAMERLADPP